MHMMPEHMVAYCEMVGTCMQCLFCCAYEVLTDIHLQHYVLIKETLQTSCHQLLSAVKEELDTQARKLLGLNRVPRVDNAWFNAKPESHPPHRCCKQVPLHA